MTDSEEVEDFEVAKSSNFFPISLDSFNREKPGIVEFSDNEITPRTVPNIFKQNTHSDVEVSHSKTNIPKRVHQHITIEDQAAINSANEFAQQIIRASCNGDQGTLQYLTDQMMKKLGVDDRFAKGSKDGDERVIEINLDP